MKVVTGRSIGAELSAEGLLPKNCTVIDVHITPTGAVTITYTVTVARDDIAKFARAMLRASSAPDDGEQPT